MTENLCNLLQQANARLADVWAGSITISEWMVMIIVTLLAVTIALAIYNAPLTMEGDKIGTKTRMPWRRPFGLSHLAGSLGILLIVLNLGIVWGEWAFFGHEPHAWRATTWNWIAYGGGSLLILLATVAVPARIVWSGFVVRRERWKAAKRVVCGTFLLILIAILEVVPILTSVTEAACSNECHEQFVQVLKNDDEAVGYAASHPDNYGVVTYPPDGWATKDFDVTMIAVALSTVVLGLAGGLASAENRDLT